MIRDTRGCFKSPTHHDSSLTAPEVSMAVTQTVPRSMPLQWTHLIIVLMRKPWLISLHLPQASVLLGAGLIFPVSVYLLKLGHNMPLTGESLLELATGMIAAKEIILQYCIIIYFDGSLMKVPPPPATVSYLLYWCSVIQVTHTYLLFNGKCNASDYCLQHSAGHWRKDIEIMQQ